MKKVILAFIILSLVFSCKQAIVTDNLKQNQFTFFKETYRKADSTIHLDSVRIIKLDTVKG